MWKRKLIFTVVIVVLLTVLLRRDLPHLALAQSTAPASRPATLPAIIGRAGRFDARPAPRPALTDEQYKQLAADLRAQYSQPPDQWPAATIPEGLKVQELGLLPKPEHPAANPFTREKAALGRQLFLDPRLSGSGQISCANCHEPELGWGDGRTVSFGHNRSPTKRNAPTVMNTVYATSLFHDGRAVTLEEQVLEPIIAEGEMAGDPATIVARLSSVPSYRQQFKAVFGADKIEMADVAKALACFERTITAGRSPFDRFLKAPDKFPLNDDAVRGLHLFRTTAGCLQCHSGPNFSDNQFHNLGLSYYGRKLQDLGRYELTKDPADVGKFRTPTLRNITRTSPYMHNGLFELRGVLNLYNAGMPTLRPKPEQANDPLFPTKSPLLKPLGLNRHDLDDLTAFLKSLEEPRQRLRMDLVPDEPAP